MKKIIILLCLLVTTTNAQKRKTTKYNIINTKMERFDIERFEKFTDGDKSNKRYYFKDEQNREVKQDWLASNRSRGYEYTETVYHDSLYAIFKTFYPNGMIQSKVQFAYEKDIYLYYQYLYNDRGELVSKEDMEAGYKFRWDDLVAYCQKNKIDIIKAKIDQWFRNEIITFDRNPDFRLPKKYWFITYKGEYEGVKGYRYLTIDGTNGEKILEEFSKVPIMDSSCLSYKVIFIKKEPKPETTKGNTTTKKSNTITNIDNNSDNGDDENYTKEWLILLFGVILFALIIFILKQNERTLFNR